ncbi:hypothetical protein OS493_017576 [Desmophyllum pertusum]|uniref:Lipoxygenase domain-containing protein n=1 Tax=Desmophyllum pertusum TaxID=174260 RepID=A0A9X0D552_9CNID|nr:hypothetical protein OS493_017576 [Desmophyllum pertusum]
MELPLKFPVTQEMVGNLLDDGDTLQQAIKNGRVYLVDYEILDDIPQYGTLNRKLERRYTCPALGLFYVRSNGDIMPIAIQLQQQPSDQNPIWTPNDLELDWIYAKMLLRNADAQCHQMISHLLRTHLFMEPIAVATRRQLPSLHPLWKLLSPHLRGTLAINTFGRHVFITCRGVGKRGVHDADKLPGFHYRDDALRVWKAIKEYITDILKVYYHSDDDIKQDTELQAWIGDLHDNGYPARGAENSHGFPSSVTSLEQLAHILTMVIFTCSSQHAAVNFSQLDAYGFQPHTPSLMRQLPPKTKGLVNEEHIMNSLPTAFRLELP